MMSEMVGSIGGYDDEGFNKIFRVLDEDGSGTIEKHEMIKYLKTVI